MIQSKPNKKYFKCSLFFPKKTKTEISFKFNSKNTEQIHSSNEDINGVYRYRIIIKHIFISKTHSENVEFSSNNNNEIFKVSFTDEGMLIFNPTLKIKNSKTSNEKEISQKQILKNINKINIFEKSLEQSKENDKLVILCKNSVDFFNSNSDFELLIYLFIKVCGIKEDFKDIGKKLLKILWEKITEDNINQLINQNINCKQT